MLRLAAHLLPAWVERDGEPHTGMRRVVRRRPRLTRLAGIGGDTLPCSMRLATLPGVALLVCACGLLPSAPDQRPAPAEAEPVPALQEPPPVLINGVVGRPISWCWVGGCADGFVNSPVGLPEVSPPFEVELPEGARIEGVRGVGPAAAGGQSMAIEHDGTEIGDVPDGAVMLNIGIRFDQGGDGSYYWALADAGN